LKFDCLHPQIRAKIFLMHRARASLSLLLVFALSLSSGAAEPRKKRFSELKKGPPTLMQTALAPAAYKVSRAKPLRKAELLYFNVDYARELGYEIPAEGITPAFEREILSALAIQIPADGDPADAFGDEWIDVYADGYGADDTVNLGSGRAASYDDWQAKGIGRTQHVRDPDPWHSNGAAYTAEGLKEAFFGEITHNEFANGANRVLAVISTGTIGATKEHPRIPRALIIRKDPVRPAQYIRNYASRTPEEIAWDSERVRKVLPKLVDALPQPPGAPASGRGMRLHSGLLELVDRLSIQLADEYTTRLHHGAYSVSNAMIDGGSIDFGSITGLDGWTRYLTVSIGKPFGDPTEPFEWILEPFIKDLQKNLPPKMARYVPSVEKVRERFIQGYFTKSLPERILRLTGIPPELLREMRGDASAHALGTLLVELTRAGNVEVHAANGTIPPDQGTYDVRRILRKLNRGEALDASDVADAGLRNRIEENWSRFRQDLVARAERQGISPIGLRTYMEHASEAITRKLPETYNTPETFEGWWKAAGDFYRTKDRRAIQKYMDARIESNIRTFRDAGAFETVLWQRSEPEFGYGIRRVFNARTGRYSDVIRIAESAGQVNFFGTVVEGKLERARLLVSSERGQGTRAFSGQKTGDYIEYRIPSVGRDGPSELRLRDAAGKELAISPRSRHGWLWGVPERCAELLKKAG
jgi:hypothetical protein